jgi:hypothetical protein
MNTYEKTILEALVQSYERSKRSKGQTPKRRLGLHFKFTEKTMPRYFSEDSYLYKDEIEASVEKLKTKGFIKTTRNPFSNELERVTLELETIETIYEYLGKKSPSTINRAIEKVLNAHIDDHEPVSTIAKILLERVKNNASLKRWFDPNRPKDLADLLKGVSSLTKNERSVSKRRFSVEVYQDSKRLEYMSNKLVNLFSLAGMSFDSSKEMFESFGIASTPTYVHIKGNGVFTLFDMVIDLTKTGNEWILSSEQLPHVSCRSLEGHTVMTIENYTSFSDYTPKHGMTVYLAGFHNRAKTTFLQTIKKDQPDTTFYHFGDIDVGGLRILANLRTKTGIDVKPYCMDKKTFIDHKKSWRPLDDHERKTLKDMLHEKAYASYRDLIETMIKTGSKLEQEAVDPN